MNKLLNSKIDFFVYTQISIKRLFQDLSKRSFFLVTINYFLNIVYITENYILVSKYKKLFAKKAHQNVLAIYKNFQN